MGRLFLVDLEFEDPHHSIAVCSICHTHISDNRDLMHYEQLEEGDVSEPNFSKVVNVQDSEKHVEIGVWTLYNVYCVKCGEHLGVKHIYTDSSAEGANDDVSVFYNLFKTKLSLWDGNVYSVYPYPLPN